MTSKRLEAIGIKQVVRIEWYELALDMLIAGEKPEEIRKQLDEFISERLQRGGYGERGEQTYTKAVSQVMKCWVTPAKDLTAFRNRALALAHDTAQRMPLHWAVTIAAYPFWFRVAAVVGRLLNLQDRVTQGQIRQRCFETMGERSTVERSTRRTIRSFVAWGTLKDSEVKGAYEKAPAVSISDLDSIAVLFEGVLHAMPESTGSLSWLVNNPAFFPFLIPMVAGDSVAQKNSGISIARYGLDDEYLLLNK